LIDPSTLFTEQQFKNTQIPVQQSSQSTTAAATTAEDTTAELATQVLDDGISTCAQEPVIDTSMTEDKPVVKTELFPGNQLPTLQGLPAGVEQQDIDSLNRAY
jgi:hypothetical protein